MEIEMSEAILRELKMIRKYRESVIKNDEDLKNVIKDIEAVAKDKYQVTTGMLRDDRDVVESKLNSIDVEGAEDVKFILINHIETLIEECAVNDIVDKLINDVDDERLEREIINKVKVRLNIERQ